MTIWTIFRTCNRYPYEDFEESTFYRNDQNTVVLTFSDEKKLELSFHEDGTIKVVKKSNFCDLRSDKNRIYVTNHVTSCELLCK